MNYYIIMHLSISCPIPLLIDYHTFTGDIRYVAIHLKFFLGSTYPYRLCLLYLSCRCCN